MLPQSNKPFPAAKKEEEKKLSRHYKNTNPTGMGCCTHVRGIHSVIVRKNIIVPVREGKVMKTRRKSGRPGFN